MAVEPFTADVLDELVELAALSQALRLANGFALLFARCNQPTQRAKLIAKLQLQLSEADGKVQVIEFDAPVAHLLDELRGRIESPRPLAIFVTCLENSITGAPSELSSQFLANLNASRNSYSTVVPCPLVFWLPGYAVAAIAQNAPDFFSIRSGLYFFAVAPRESRYIIDTEHNEYWEVTALSADEKARRIETIRRLLQDYELLAPSRRDHQAELNLTDHLAVLYFACGRYAEAEPLLERALKIREAALGPDQPGTASSLNNLAALYKSVGRYADAEPLFKRALRITEAVLGPDHPDTATSLNNLADLYQSIGRYSDAEPLFNRALRIRESALGSDHPDTATSLNNMGGFLRSVGRSTDAEPLYLRALRIMEAALGRDHPDAATSLNNLAGLYHSVGRYADAEPHFERALAIREMALGPDHPDTATSLNNLAGLYESVGRYTEAAPLYERALRILEATLGPRHPKTIIIINNFATMLESSGRTEEAGALRRRNELTE